MSDRPYTLTVVYDEAAKKYRGDVLKDGVVIDQSWATQRKWLHRRFDVQYGRTREWREAQQKGGAK